MGAHARMVLNQWQSHVQASVCVCWGLCGGGCVDEVARATPVAARDIGNAEHKLAGPSEDAVSEGLVLFTSYSL